MSVNNQEFWMIFRNNVDLITFTNAYFTKYFPCIAAKKPV